jgi:hypothetical protein
LPADTLASTTEGCLHRARRRLKPARSLKTDRLFDTVTNLGDDLSLEQQELQPGARDRSGATWC